MLRKIIITFTLLITLSTNGTCYELPPDILEDEHPIAIAIAPARKKRQRYCKHEDFGTCGSSKSVKTNQFSNS